MTGHGWESCARPAERAVAVLQAADNWFRADRFESRWGREALKELLDARVLRLFPKLRFLSLEPKYCVRDQWQLRFAEEYGEAGLRKEIESQQRDRMTYLKDLLSAVGRGEFRLKPRSLRIHKRNYRKLLRLRREGRLGEMA